MVAAGHRGMTLTDGKRAEQRVAAFSPPAISPAANGPPAIRPPADGDSPTPSI